MQMQSAAPVPRAPQGLEVGLQAFKSPHVHVSTQVAWQAVSHLGLLRRSGDFVTGNLVGAPYLVCRDEDGQLRAFHNVRHGINASLWI